MANANPSAPAMRPSKDGVLETLERLGVDARRTQPVVRPRPLARRASGIFRFGDEYAGLERLDRAELDEDDE